MRRQRELSAQRRADGTARMRAGDEEVLPRRDQGPERRLVRDIVDSRRNASGALLPMGVLLFGTLLVPNLTVKVILTYTSYLFLLLVLFDGLLLNRRIKRLVRERFPKTREGTGRLTFYGVNRGMLPRRWRVPAAQVGPGDRI